MKIEMGRKYQTKSGNPVTVLSTTLRRPRSVLIVEHQPEQDVAWHLFPNGRINQDIEETFIVEITPWDDLKIDDPVIVWDGDETIKRKRHFAGVDELTGKPMAWQDGLTSWTAGSSPNAWEHCERAERES